MKVLFVSGGNLEKFSIPPLIKAQGESLKKNGVILEYFPIVGKGIKGYLANIQKLRKHLEANPVDIVHAHFSFSGVVASFANRKTPVITSLLGSDVNSNSLLKKVIIQLRNILSWKAVIVKSDEMNKKISGKDGIIIPNGVNTDHFYPMDSLLCKKKLNWDLSKKHILFAANPNRPEKNYLLSEKAIAMLPNKENLELHFLNNIEHHEVPTIINASDLVLLSSLWEGSPNVVKEAMACNRPVVSTNVGDLQWLFGEVPGYFLSNFTPENLSSKIGQGVKFSENFVHTKGRERIVSLGLSSDLIAQKIINVYKSVLYS